MSSWFRARYSLQWRLPSLRVGNGWIYVMIALWGTAVLAGIVKVWQYQLTPGAAAAPAPSIWPVDSSIPAHSGRALLIMVAHPQCTCTRASLNELRRVMVRLRALKNPPDVYLSIIAPEGVGADWTDGPVLRNASTIRNLNIVIDPGERFARKFGATTSGHMLLYGANGRLLFSGGITDARAHEGDAVGQEAIVAALYEKTPAVTQTPVFGCALEKPLSRPGPVSN